MENTINVNEVVRTAVELEKVKAEVVEIKAKAKLFETLYNEEKAKENAPKKIEVRVTEQKKERTWGGGYNITSNVVDVFTTTAEDVVAKVKKVIDSKKDEEIEANASTIKELTKQIDNLSEEQANEIAKHAKYYNKLANKNREEYNEKRENLEKKIFKLKEELEKEQFNKSDREVEKQLAEDKAVLISRITTLEDEVRLLTNLNWFSRTWLWKSILNLRAKVEAARVDAKAKRMADDVISSNTSYWGW